MEVLGYVFLINLNAVHERVAGCYMEDKTEQWKYFFSCMAKVWGVWNLNTSLKWTKSDIKLTLKISLVFILLGTYARASLIIKCV